MNSDGSYAANIQERPRCSCRQYIALHDFHLLVSKPNFRSAQAECFQDIAPALPATNTRLLDDRSGAQLLTEGHASQWLSTGGCCLGQG